MFITNPHLRCDYNLCEQKFEGDRGLDVDERSLIEQAESSHWVIANTNAAGLHFCGPAHARDFFEDLARAHAKDSDPFKNEDRDEVGMFWNRFMAEFANRGRR